MADKLTIGALIMRLEDIAMMDEDMTSRSQVFIDGEPFGSLSLDRLPSGERVVNLHPASYTSEEQ